MTILPIGQITSYHAHIYFRDASERQAAEWVRQRIAERFSVQLGNWHDQLVGPHERPMYQVAFGVAQFPSFVPWLMLNRQNLTILVHPNTGNARRDHIVHALWLGEVLAIMRPEQLPETPVDRGLDEVTPNTAPILHP